MAALIHQAPDSYMETEGTCNRGKNMFGEALSATRLSVGKACRQGDRVTYMVSIVNSGTIQYTGLKVEDFLGCYTVKGRTAYLKSYVADSTEYYVNGVLQAVPDVTEGPPLMVTGITVPARGNVTILYQADINEFSMVPSGAAVNDTVIVRGAGISITAGNPKKVSKKG